MKNVFIHEKALVETKNIGEGSRIWAFVHILRDARIGKNANICDNCFIENKVAIGDNVTVKCGVYLWDGVKIGNKVQIGPSVAFTNDLYPRSKNKDFKIEKTILEDGCSIGANATILAKTRIGKNALVGAGSVVTKDVPDFALVYGVPAVLKGYLCICCKKLKFLKGKSKCRCGRVYKFENSKVKLVKDI